MTVSGTRNTWPSQLDDENAIGFLHRMVKIPSPSGHEAELAHFMAGVMRELGYTVSRDEAGNVVGTIGDAGMPEIMLLGHMDTCAGDLEASFDGDRIVGRGAVDAKGPLAARVIAGARAASQMNGGCQVSVIGVVEEETPQSKGAVAIGRNRPAPRSLIIGEPSGWSAVVIGYKGKLDVRAVATVPATHPTAPVVKASELIAQAWQELLEQLGDNATHTVFDRPAPTLTWIRGDLVKCAAEFSVRTPHGFDHSALVAKLRERLPDVTFETIGSVAAVEADTTNVVCRALRTAIRAQGCAPRILRKTATSDMNILAERWSVGMATYGPGDSRLDHSDEEHITVSEYLRGVEVLTDALLAINEEHNMRSSEARYDGAPSGVSLRPVRDNGASAK